MSKRKQNIPGWALGGHRRPVTRREMLAAGIIPFAARLFAPAWTSLLLPEDALAQAAPPMVPFITVNLEGGMAMVSNWMPLDVGGQLLRSYDTFGLGTGTPNSVTEFGNVRFATNSGFLAGLRAAAADAIPNTAFVGVPVRTIADSPDNPLAVEGMLAKAGLYGSLTPNLANRNRATGQNNAAAVMRPPAPLFVQGLNSITSSLTYGGALANMSAAQKTALANVINNMSRSQMDRFSALSTGAQIKAAMDSAGSRTSSLMSGTGPTVDPRSDAAVSAQLNTIWGINGGTAQNNQNLIFATMVYNTIKGQAASAVIELGGYDYHALDRAGTDAKDNEAGTLVGRILATARALNKPVFVYVTSDGGMISDPGGQDIGKDTSVASALYTLYYDPAGRRPTTSTQIGQFTQAQAADPAFITGGSVTMAAAAVVANYLQINGKLGMFAEAAPRTIPAESLGTVVKYA